MQAIVPPAARNPAGRSRADILAALQGLTGSRRMRFRYELLDSTGTYVRDLDNVESGSVSQDWLADIKRTARFRLREAGDIDYLSDRIKPYVRLLLPPYGAQDWVEWPQGVFVLSSPKRSVDASGVVRREVEAYDLLQLYVDDRVTGRYAVAAGSGYVATVQSLLGSVPVRVTPSSATVPVDREYEPGTSKLMIINDLLSAINYQSLSFDEDGVAVVRPYVSPDGRTEEYEYASGASGLMVPEADHLLDPFSVPNQWTLVVSEPERAPLVATYTNASPSSPTSTVRRGRTITDFRREESAVDLATLQAKAARLAFEASQVFEAVEFSTALMPIHSGNDVYRIRYDALSINARYTEQSWSMDLRAGAQMKHRARRVVTV